MAKCKECTKEFGMFELKGGICKPCILKRTPKCPDCGLMFEKELLINGLCQKCKTTRDNKKKVEIEKSKVQIQKNRIANATKEVLEKIILTTETHVDFKIDKRLDIITAECVLGMGIISDFVSGIRDSIGGRDNTTQNSLREAKNTVLEELRKEAFSIGANAVIAVDLDYSEFSGKGKSMLFIVASGTAIISSEIK